MALRHVALAAALAAPTDPADADNQPFWTGHPDAPTFERAVDARLDHARDLLARLVGARGKRTPANTLVPYDQLMRELDRAGSATGLIQKVHPDSALREAADRSDRKVSALATEISLDRRVFDAVRTMDLSDADPVTRHYVGRILRDFRLAGVDRDSATRVRIKELREELVVIGQEFDRHIRDDVRTIEVGSAAELAGLPEDYITAHPPGPDGRIRLTTEYPDVFPVFTYARSDDLRRRLRTEFDNRAYPANVAVLDRMIARRHELARLLGYGSWADYALADKMTGSAANASAFVDRVVVAAGEAAQREYETLLRRKRQDDPAATGINRWEVAYLRELVRRSDYDFDSQKVRPYLPYQRVKQGVLDLSARLFRVTFRRMRTRRCGTPRSKAGRCTREGGSPGASTSTCTPDRGSSGTRRISGSAPAPPTARSPNRRWSATSPGAIRTSPASWITARSRPSSTSSVT
jgi:thimet oligopeptidase